jgi:hypothetical protein
MNGWMIMNNISIDLERSNRLIMPILILHLIGKTEKNHEKVQSGWQGSWLRFKSITDRSSRCVPVNEVWGEVYTCMEFHYVSKIYFKNGYCKLVTNLPLNLIFRPPKLGLFIHHGRSIPDINNALRESVLKKVAVE